MDRIKVSVIICVYNVERYLRQCVESVMNQTLKEIEIICVDDCSSDSSLAILNDLQDEDSRIKVIALKENRGAGAARNAGLAVASGKYLSFLDSDDYFEKSMLKTAYDKAESVNAEIVCFRSDRWFDNDEHQEDALWTIKEKQFPEKAVFAAWEIRPNIFRSMVGWAWDKLILKEFVDKNHLVFQEIKIHNDMAFTYSAVCIAERITFADKVLVHQRIRTSGSLSNKDTVEKSLVYIGESLCELKKRLLNYNVDQQMMRDFDNYAADLFAYHMGRLNGKNRECLYVLINNWIKDLGMPCNDRLYYYDTRMGKRISAIHDGVPYNWFEELEKLGAFS